MNIVLGASGQVGSAIIDNLLHAKAPVKGVFHSTDKAEKLRSKGVPATVADSFDLPALRSAFQKGDTVFVLTPEPGSSNDVLGDTQKILKNYREAITGSPIKKIVGLSSMGAQCTTDFHALTTRLTRFSASRMLAIVPLLKAR